MNATSNPVTTFEAQRGLREKFWAGNRKIEVSTVNGEAGLSVRDGQRLTAVMSIATDGERILAVYSMVNPDKLNARS